MNEALTTYLWLLIIVYNNTLMSCDAISIYISIFPFCIWKNSWRRLCIIQKLKQLITLLWIFVKGDEKRKFKISPFRQFISYLKQILARKTRLNIGMHFNILASKTADIINARNIKSTQNNQDQDKVIIWYCKNEWYWNSDKLFYCAP